MSVNKYKTKKSIRYAVRLYISKDEQGKQHYYVKKGFKSEKEAKLHEARKKIEFEDVGYKKMSDDTFKTIYLDWSTTYKNRVQQTTFQRTEDLFRLHILPQFGEKRVVTISPVFCQNSINTWAESFANIKQLKSYTSQIFDHAIFSELLVRNPMKNVKLPKKEKKQNENYFTLKELKEFVSILNFEEPINHVLLFQLLISTGIRKGELSAIRWSDIDFTRQTIHIEKSYATIKNSNLNAKRKTIRIRKETKNVSSTRVIPISTLIVELLKKWRTIQSKELLLLGINASNKDQLIFTYINADGELNQPIHADYSNNIMKRIEKKYGLKHVTIHGLRHTHATLLLESGANIKETQDRLGHKNAQTTLNTYAHVTEKAQRNAMEKFENYTGL